MAVHFVSGPIKHGGLGAEDGPGGGRRAGSAGGGPATRPPAQRPQRAGTTVNQRPVWAPGGRWGNIGAAGIGQGLTVLTLTNKAHAGRIPDH